mmetsp:Transcript_89617/g.232340  ORF Transcript_89617/g.232340 Transcript_89617/m.232340 type:complete len:304 (+) Transcript_89617:1426-2337(+)
MASILKREAFIAVSCPVGGVATREAAAASTEPVSAAAASSRASSSARPRCSEFSSSRPPPLVKSGSGAVPGGGEWMAEGIALCILEFSILPLLDRGDRMPFGKMFFSSDRMMPGKEKEMLFSAPSSSSRRLQSSPSSSSMSARPPAAPVPPSSLPVSPKPLATSLTLSLVGRRCDRRRKRPIPSPDAAELPRSAGVTRTPPAPATALPRAVLPGGCKPVSPPWLRKLPLEAFPFRNDLRVPAEGVTPPLDGTVRKWPCAPPALLPPLPPPAAPLRSPAPPMPSSASVSAVTLGPVAGWSAPPK